MSSASRMKGNDTAPPDERFSEQSIRQRPGSEIDRTLATASFVMKKGLFGVPDS